MAFNLEDYETVESRLEKWHGKFPDNRIETELIEASNTRFIVFCKLFKTEADPKPCATGLAFETISDRGVNATSALENCETSAIGRALANAGFAAKGKRASQEEMSKVKQAEKPFEVAKSFQDKLQSRQNMYGKAGSKSAQIETILRDSFAADKKEPEPVAWSVGDVVDQIGSAIPNEPPVCQHGHILKEGISKGGKPYYGYVCKAKECPPNWATLTANGKWYFKGGE
jgi:hypothetical protein